MNLDDLKKLQLRIIKNNKKCNLFGIVFFFILSIVTMIIFLLNKMNFLFLFISFFIIFTISLIFSLVIKAMINGNDIVLFNKEFKNIFVLKSLQNSFQNLFYDPNKGFSEEFIDNVGMINIGDVYQSNDYVSGTYKNIRFEQADVHIKEKHKEKEKDGKEVEVLETIFMGKIMIFDFNKNFKANLQVSSFGFSTGSWPYNKNISVVNMEDVEFNGLFKVYTEDEQEAYYILTPHFMEKLKAIVVKLNCEISFFFNDRKLYISLDNHCDSFEWNVLDVIDENKIEDNITKDINLIVDFVEELNLDNELFKDRK